MDKGRPYFRSMLSDKHSLTNIYFPRQPFLIIFHLTHRMV